DRHLVADLGVGDHAVIQHRHAITDPRVDDARAAVDFTAAADRGVAFEVDVRMDHGIRRHGDVAVDVRGCRVLDRHTRCHQFGGLLFAHDAAHGSQFRAAVDAANLVGFGPGHRFHDHP